ncbi:hypothetical protein LSAT2_004984 [Lamellibrachia satsuma]|nr:hypothetical protein LSAT2_004984 [Lamellibrachia satsuma]
MPRKPQWTIDKQSPIQAADATLVGALDDSRSSRWPPSCAGQGDSCKWLVKACGAIPSAMIEYSIKKCGVSNNGTDDFMFEDVYKQKLSENLDKALQRIKEQDEELNRRKQEYERQLKHLRLLTREKDEMLELLSGEKKATWLDQMTTISLFEPVKRQLSRFPSLERFRE